MDFITIAVSGLAGFAVGLGTYSLITSGAREKYREIIAAKDKLIVERDEHISDPTGELTQTGNRAGELRTEKADLARKLGRADAEVNRLKPLADLGLQVKQQRENALAKAAEANRARAAAKAANGSTAHS